jgi:hypothetical protein
MQDASYHGCIELEGSQNRLVQVLKMITLPSEVGPAHAR